MRRSRLGYCPDGCGGGFYGHHPMCPSAEQEPDHDEECLGGYCPGHFLVGVYEESGLEEFEDCPCLCHKEEDE